MRARGIKFLPASYNPIIISFLGQPDFQFSGSFSGEGGGVQLEKEGEDDLFWASVIFQFQWRPSILRFSEDRRDIKRY